MFAQPADPVAMAIQRAKDFDLNDVAGGVVCLTNVGPIGYELLPLDEFDCTSKVKAIIDEVLITTTTTAFNQNNCQLK